MNILLNTLGDPIWQVLALVITLAAPVLIVAVRTRDVHAPAHEMRRDTLTILRVWLATFLLMSGVAVALHLPDAAPQRMSSTAPSPVPTSSPTPSPTSTPTSIPTPTPTPRLAHSITQVLTTFCDAITTQDYQTAWNQYARSLQHTHPQAETFAAWRKFTRCSIPDQSGDPSALTILTLTFATGYTDRFGRGGDVDYGGRGQGLEDYRRLRYPLGGLLCCQLGLERRGRTYERDCGESGRPDLADWRGDHYAGSAGTHPCPAQSRGSSLTAAPMVLDPVHGACRPLTFPRAQRGSRLVPWSTCRSHRRACSDTALIGSGFASRRALAHVDVDSFADPIALALPDAVSPGDSRALPGAHNIL